MSCVSKQNLALASAALSVGATFNVASAATISAAPAGFTGTTFTEDDASTGSFDVTGSGKRSVTVQGTSEKTAPEKDPNGKPTGGTKILTPGGIALSSNQGVTFYVDGMGKLGTSQTAEVPNGLSTSATANIAIGSTSNFGSSPSYGFVAYEGKPDKTIAPGMTFPGFPAGNGYIQGTFSDRTFTLLDYGRIVPDTGPSVPEPETWALLTLGFGGIGAAMRRSRRAQQRRASLVAA